MRILAFFPLLQEIHDQKTIRGSERRFLEMSSHLKKFGAKIYTIEYYPSLQSTWGYNAYKSITIQRRFKNHTVLETVRLVFYGINACIKHRCNLIYLPSHIQFGTSRTLSIIPAYIISLLCRKPLAIVFHHLTQTDHDCRNPVLPILYRKAATCIAVSKATAIDLNKTFKIKRIAITGNGVNLETFSKNHKQTQTNDAIYLGRISEKKGILNLINAWKEVTEKLPSARLVLVGGIDKGFENKVTDTITELSLQSNIKLTGLVSDQKVRELLQASRIFVLPSIEEGFGLAAAEAMAAGLPCILSDIPALREAFGSAAIFVEPDNSTELSAAILNLLSDSDKRAEMIEKGSKLANELSWDKIAKMELRVLEKALTD